MFLASNNHLQGSLFNSEKGLNNTLQCILKNNWSSIFYEKVFMHIDEQDFKDMYDPIYGRVNFPVNILAALEIIKEIYNLTDEQLVESYHFNYLYQKAVGVQNINQFSFTIRTLYNFRKSYCKHEKRTGTDLFKQVFKDGRDKIIQDLGLNTSTQRTDSVMIGANIKRMNRLSLFHKVLSNLIKCVRKVEITISEELNSIISQEEDGYYYRLPKAMVQAKTEQLGNYIFIYVKRFENDERVNKKKAFIDAKRVLEEQCTVRKDNKIELKEPKEISSSSMQNPSDKDATYRFKNKKSSPRILYPQTLKADGTLNANFDSTKCAVCPLKEKCIAYKSEKGEPSICFLQSGH